MTTADTTSDPPSDTTSDTTSDPPCGPLLDLTPAARLLGRELVAVDASTGEARLRFTAPAEFCNRHGTVQGGLLSAMLDSATGIALISTLPPGLTAVTTRLDTRFVSPASLGSLTAVARIVTRNERTAQVDASIADNHGKTVATAQVEFRIVRRK